MVARVPATGRLFFFHVFQLAGGKQAYSMLTCIAVEYSTVAWLDLWTAGDWRSSFFFNCCYSNFSVANPHEYCT